MPKLLGDIPPVDIVVTMGCNVYCPEIPAKHREDWGLDDPTGQSDEVFLATMTIIENKIRDLKDRILNDRLIDISNTVILHPSVSSVVGDL